MARSARRADAGWRVVRVRPADLVRARAGPDGEPAGGLHLSDLHRSEQYLCDYVQYLWAFVMGFVHRNQLHARTPMPSVLYSSRPVRERVVVE